MSFVLSPYVCGCSCHSNNGVMHMVACCEECSYCKAGISMGYMENHLKECEVKLGLDAAATKSSA